MMVTVVAIVVVISLADAAEPGSRRLMIAPKGEHITVLRRLTAVAHFTIHHPALNPDDGHSSFEGMR